MASALCAYHASTFSWKGLLEELEIVDSLTTGEVQEVAARVFNPDNFFAGFVLPLKA